MDVSSWFSMVVELLHTDTVATASLLVALGGSLRATVALIEADLTVEEALSYASLLFDLGDEDRGTELAREAVSAAFGGEGLPPGQEPARA